MKIKFVWKVLSEDGLLKDPPIFSIGMYDEYDVNRTEDYEDLKSEEQAYENLLRIKKELNDYQMSCLKFILVKIVEAY